MNLKIGKGPPKVVEGNAMSRSIVRIIFRLEVVAGGGNDGSLGGVDVGEGVGLSNILLVTITTTISRRIVTTIHVISINLESCNNTEPSTIKERKKKRKCENRRILFRMHTNQSSIHQHSTIQYITILTNMTLLSVGQQFPANCWHPVYN
mmetsp:Transcript_6399/g.15045  ORF Transcript_6399/g.15045 Transcript_6399/m.15045 type:complete len:150 (+) Transcript_6399:3276-3725(+)